uniref:Natterin-3 n=1 Tax=Oryzias latipes TaxID=8090 RepID=A0A3P9J9T2_ORYLA
TELSVLSPHCILLSVHSQPIKSLSTVWKITDKLYWKTWEGSLPSGAVHIKNDYCNRIDYVSKPSGRGDCGFYTESKGQYCYYALGDHLVWKKDSNGQVPKNAVESDFGLYVGKNKYGLGKVHPVHHSLFIPRNGREYWYHDYKYQIDKAETEYLFPETIRTIVGTVVNESKWDFTISNTSHAEMTISSKIPSICDMSVTFGAEETFTTSKGGSRKEEKQLSEEVTVKVLSKQKLHIMMVVSKCKLDIPFTARLTRTYNNGTVRSTNISGTYRGACVSEVKVEVKEV